MYVHFHDQRARCGLSPPGSGGRARSDVSRSAEPATPSDRGIDHDETLLVAALEVIESRRAAIEWLLEADLLRLCLV
jgi:hypothetical protein